MKTASRLRAPFLAGCGLTSLVAVVGCSFDTSQLRAAGSRAPDGAVDHPAVSDAGVPSSGDTTTSPPDAPSAAGGSGGSDDARVPDAPGATDRLSGADASTGGSDGRTDASVSSVDGSRSAGTETQPTRYDGGAESNAPPIQDAEVTSDLDVGSVQDARLDLLPDGVVGPSPDGSPDRALDMARNLAGDAATDLPGGLCVPPAIPTSVAATAGIGRVTVSWTASTGIPTSYEVKRGTNPGGPFTSIGTPTASPYIDSAVTNGTTYYYVVAARNAGGVCSSANSGVASAAPRSCTVVSGAATNGHTSSFNTLAGMCFVTCDTIQSWGCSNTAGRSVTINGGPLACGALPIPAAKTPGFNVIDVTPGTLDYASLFWWGTWSTTCTIPTGGLDF